MHHGGPSIQIGRIQIDLYNKLHLSEDEELTAEADFFIYLFIFMLNNSVCR